MSCTLKSGIYAITNLSNGKVYVGSAVNLKTRKRVHFNNLRKNKHHNVYLQNSFNKHGENSFEFSILEYVTLDRLIIREQHWIDQYDFNVLYNLSPTAGSPLGVKHTPENIKKATDAFLANGGHPSKRKVYQIDINTGKVIREWPSVFMAALELNTPDENIFKVCGSREDNGYIRKSAAGYFWSFTPDYVIPKIFSAGETQMVRVAKIDLMTNEVIETYNSISEAGRITGNSPGNIKMVCNKLRNMCGGFRWAYLEHDNTVNKLGKLVVQIDKKSGDVLGVFDSIAEASQRTGVSYSVVTRICNGDTKHPRQFEFYYAFT